LFEYTGCLQKHGAVSKINQKFISHLTRAKRTPSAAATVPSFSCINHNPSMCAPESSDFSGEKIHSMPSIGGEAKPSVCGM
jgi:hypothetical protein